MSTKLLLLGPKLLQSQISIFSHNWSIRITEVALYSNVSKSDHDYILQQVILYPCDSDFCMSCNISTYYTKKCAEIKAQLYVTALFAETGRYTGVERGCES